MQSTLQIVVMFLGFVAVGSFVGGFAANVMLAPYLDVKEVKKRTGLGVFWQFGNPAVTIECYKEGGRSLWKVRDCCLKIFAISAGLIAIVMVVAAIAGVSFESPK